MRQCSNCGLENPESAFSCQSCGTNFSLIPQPDPAPSLKSDHDGRGEQSFAASEQRWRGFELFLVCFIAFGGALLMSTHYLFTGLPQSGNRDSFRWWYTMCHEVGALLLVGYVLKRHGEGFSNIGLRWNWLDVAIAPVLCVVCWAAHYAVRSLIWTYAGSLLDAKANAQIVKYIFSGEIGAGALVFAILNPFFEELIARAFLMTQLRQLGMNAVIAVTASVALQTSYHFYQGAWEGLSHAGEFLVLSIYYSTTRRIVAPIIVHMIFDMWATVCYMVHSAG